MAAEKGDGPTRRKGRAERGSGERLGRTAEKAGRDATVVEDDPWGSFFETFWGQPKGESAERRDREPPAVKGARKPGAKPGQ